MLILWAHVAAVVWLMADVDRLKLLAYDFREVPSESFVNVPPDRLRADGYTEDDPADLAPYRSIATSVTAGASSDAERLRRLADYIYGLRKAGHGDLDEMEVRRGPSVLLADMTRGSLANCGQMSAMMQVFWRSLGGDARGVRWSTQTGDVGHYGFEAYSPAARRWLYYDMNMNGYLADEDGVPLSLSTLRADLLADQDLHFVSNAAHRDWTPDEFATFIEQYSVSWWVLNNRITYMERDRRFGRLNALYRSLARLPYPLDRVMDNVTGDRDRRLVGQGTVQIAGLFTFIGARLVLGWSTLVILGCLGTLMATRRAPAPPPLTP